MTKQNTKNFVGVSLLVWLMLHLSGCSATAGIKPSQATCNQFLQKMQAHQYQAAYGLLSAKCKTVTTQQQMQNYWDLVEKNRGKVQSWSQRGVQVYAGTGGSAVNLDYALQCANGASGVHFTCVLENNTWVIMGFLFRG